MPTAKKRGRPPRQPKIGEPSPESAYGVALSFGLLEKVMIGPMASTRHSAVGWERYARSYRQGKWGGRGHPLGKQLTLQILWLLKQSISVPDIAHCFGVSLTTVRHLRTQYYREPGKVRTLRPYLELSSPDVKEPVYRCLVCGSLKANRLEMEAHCFREVIPAAYLALNWPFTPEETEILGGM